MQDLSKSIAAARGELKRMKTDLNKLKSEEKFRMKKIEEIVSTRQITIEQVNQLQNGKLEIPEINKKRKINPADSSALSRKIELSSVIASPIGFIKSPYLTKSGTPRQPGLVDTISTIQLSQGETGKEIIQRWMPKDALEGLEQYSHCWLIFHFHLNDPGSNGRKSKVAPPRGDGKKVGIFASRAPYRPSPIGLTLVKIENIDLENGKISVKNCDLVNETPILDIKPYIPEYDIPSPGENIRIAKWLEEKKQKTDVKGVGFTTRAAKQCEELWDKGSFSTLEEFKNALVTVLENDPRSIYRKKQQASGENKLFFLNFSGLTITIWFDDDFAEILKLEPFYQHQK